MRALLARKRLVRPGRCGREDVAVTRSGCAPAGERLAVQTGKRFERNGATGDTPGKVCLVACDGVGAAYAFADDIWIPPGAPAVDSYRIGRNSPVGIV